MQIILFRDILLVNLDRKGDIKKETERKTVTEKGTERENFMQIILFRDILLINLDREGDKKKETDTERRERISCK